MKKVSEKVRVGDGTLVLTTGEFAQQANAAVTARLGETVVLATVVSSLPRKELDYFPLSVDYIERLYAGGRIKGSRWVKREGRPSVEAILTARLIDRSIRPLFPEGYKNEVQVVITVLSVDGQNNPDVPAMVAASAALAISDIPWRGPVGSIRLGLNAQGAKRLFGANPTYQKLESSELDLVISATKQATVMLEGGAKEVSEETILKGIEFAQKEIQTIIMAIEKLREKVGKTKRTVQKEEVDARLEARIRKEIGDELKGTVEIKELEAALAEKYEEENKAAVVKIVKKLVKEAIRGQILKTGKRNDGRKPDEIRPIEVEVGVLPRTHGSAMFKRGKTQALTITTLGPHSLEQLIENMEGEETKRYIHHYNMPPFTVGETGRMGWPSRREVGHGALAERALIPVIPDENRFPYTIRVVSEIMSSNGSTSMASVCGSSLSLMDAGVPIKAPVSGIAMGMVSDGRGKTVILSDIMGIEDFNGDMDFKVAGTKDGITAMQMDVKKNILDLGLLGKALQQAKIGRLFILNKMLQVLPAPRSHVSPLAPKIETLHIPEEKIGEVIGPGGKMIKKIIAETGAEIEVEEDGTVNISAQDETDVAKAMKWIKDLTREVRVGEIFEKAVVKRVQPFGAFVEILPGKEGLVHVSKMSTNYVKDASDVVKEGQEVKVKVVEIDKLGRINLSMIFGEKPERNFPQFPVHENKFNRSRVNQGKPRPRSGR